MKEHQGLRLLSLDGGGIRGLSELLILREIMGRIKVQDKLEDVPLPCDYFDIIGGTSTGGLIALLLGRLRMSVTQAIECYGALSEKVFSDMKHPGGDGKFKASKLEEIVKKVVKEQTGNEDERMRDMRATGIICYTFVCAMPALNMTAGIPHLFRTYEAPKYQTFNCTIWEAARATSAAPTFFKRIHIGELGESYIDGGMSCNNPIAQVLHEATLMFPHRHTACVVSIGTGKAQTIGIPKPGYFQRVLPLDVITAIQGIATDCERSAQEIARRFRPGFYFRFNVEQGLQDVGLAQWEKLDKAAAHTGQYIRMVEVDANLDAAVVAICARHNVIATADLSGTVQYSTPQQPKMKRCPPPTPVFTGRQDILLQMEEYYGNDLGRRHIFVLYGLGGAGKSQIAFKFVEMSQAASRFSKIFFVDASTAQTIITDLKNIALANEIGQTDKDTLDWLAGLCEEWLLILNNADDTTLNLRKSFPLCSHGNILITSRNHDTRRHAFGAQSHYQVSKMYPNDARDLLLKVAGIREKHTEDTKALAMTIVKKLGYLSLAVVQAGAYIYSSECGLSRFLGMYLEHQDVLLEEYHNDVQKIDDYEWTVYTTWRMSFERLNKQPATFLQLCAFLHHDGISEAIFQNAAARIMTYASKLPITDQQLKSLGKAKDFLGFFRRSELGATWDDQKFLAMIKDIRSYSLIDFEETDRTYSIHPLVHSWTRTTISNNEIEVTHTSMQYILGMSVNWKSETEDYTFRRTLLPHIDMALQGDIAAGLDVSVRFAHVYDEGGRWKDAEKLEDQVVEARKRVLGEEHPDTLMSMTSLTSIYQHQGRWTEAEKLDIKVMEVRKRMLRADHPDTLTSMASLASTYRNQGRWNEAEELDIKVMEMRKRVLGPEHPDTLISMASLTSTYRNQGRWNEAEELDIQVVETSKRVLGAEHPDTLTSIANLAATFWNQGRWNEAEELEVQVVEVRKRLLGIEHPDTLTSMANLAATYRNQRRWNEVEELEIKVMESRKRVLGAEHPRTLMSMTNLAATYLNQGQWNKAEKLNIQVVEASKRVLGAEHPDTLTGMANHAATFRSQGHLEEAEELEVHIMKARKRLLGEEHPDSLTSMASLAVTYRSQGHLEEAEELEVQVMKVRKRLLGEEHPDTLTSMANLAATCWNQGWLNEVEELDIKVVEASKRVLGAEHPDTLTSIANLAATYQNQGRWNEAEELEVQVVEASKRVLGAEHPDTLTSIANLAETYWNQGRKNEVEELEVQVMEARKRVLGTEHPDTLTSMANLAVTYWNQGQWNEAEELEVQVMEVRKRLLGEENPDTLMSMVSLAMTYRSQGRLEEAEALEVQSLETRQDNYCG